MFPYGSDSIILKLELNQEWPVGAPAGFEDEIEYWRGPEGSWVPPEWRLLSHQVARSWENAALTAGPRGISLGGHWYKMLADIVLPAGQDPTLILFEGGEDPLIYANNNAAAAAA